MDYLSIVLCLIPALFAIRLLRSTAKKEAIVLPPGPRPLPVFGNLFCLGKNPHVALAELAKTYGPLMMLQLGRVPTVIISSSKMAREALQKNDVAFSNRNVVDAVCALQYNENSVAWLPHGPDWRNLRRIASSQVFSRSRLDASQNLRRDKVKRLLDYVEECSEAGVSVDFMHAAFTAFINFVSSAFFSMDVSDLNSEFARELRVTIRGFMEEVGKPNIADYYPVLKIIDPQGNRRRMKHHLRKMMDLVNHVIDQRLHGQRPPGATQENDVLDALLGIGCEKAEDISKAQISCLLVVLKLFLNDFNSVEKNIHGEKRA